MRMVRFLVVATLVLGGIQAWMAWRLLRPLHLGGAGLWAGRGAFILATLLIPLGMSAGWWLRSRALVAALTWISGLLMAYCFTLLALVLLRDLALAWWAGPRLAAGSALAALGLALAGVLAGLVQAKVPPRLVRITVPLPDLPPALEGFTIAQISDLHVSPTLGAGFVAEVVRRVNGLEPDLIAVTGDLVDGRVADFAPDLAPLAGLRARYGVFGVTGNHEYYSGAAPWVAEYRRLGLGMLMNEHRLIRHGDARLVVAGVTDVEAGAFRPEWASDPVAALAGAPADARPRVLLAHQPRSAAAAEAAGFDLQVSGHTHGGQFWPWTPLVRLQQPFVSGLHRMGRLWVYTSRGTGYWGPPDRLGVPAELTLIRLARGNGAGPR